MSELKPLRDPAPMLDRVLQEWGGHEDLWVFGYGSLIWRPDFDFAERRPARVHGWHRALKMWSRINRGTPERPGLVFGMLSGGCCQGMVFRIPIQAGRETLTQLWSREMVMAVYDPKWLLCRTPHLERPIRDKHTGERQVIFLQLEGDLFFGVADELQDRLTALAGSGVRVVILRLKRALEADSEAA